MHILVESDGYTAVLASLISAVQHAELAGLSGQQCRRPKVNFCAFDLGLGMYAQLQGFTWTFNDRYDVIKWTSTSLACSIHADHNGANIMVLSYRLC